jgi:hypothetical protein
MLGLLNLPIIAGSKKSMKSAIAFTALTLFVLCGAYIGIAEEAAKEVHPGQTVFMASKCSMCHTVKSANILAEKPAEGTEAEEAEEDDEAVPPDLSGVGIRHEAAWMTGYLQKKEMLHDKKHSKRFTGTEEELTQLVTWLATLKQEDKPTEAKPK